MDTIFRQIYDVRVSVPNYDAPHKERLHRVRRNPMLKRYV